MDETRCIESVPYGGRMVGFHQCLRKRGHGPDGQYCKQHALDKESKVIRVAYAAKIDRFGHPALVRLDIVSETKKMLGLAGSKELLGIFYIGGRIRKADFDIFDTEDEAIEFLIDRSKAYIENLYGTIRQAEKQLEDLKAMRTWE